MERIENSNKIRDELVEPYVRLMTIEAKEHQKKTSKIRKKELATNNFVIKLICL